MNKKLISIKNLSIEKSGSLILNNLDFELNAGDYVGILGPNGAGKTTLINLIIGLDKAKSGILKLARMKMAYVPQGFAIESFHLPLNVSELLKTGLINPRAKTSQEKIQIALAKVAMNGFEKRSFLELSGGERQKIIVARALIDNPDLLILDEPTSAFDDESRKNFYKLLEALNKEGMTIILVSHDLDIVLKKVKRVLCLNKKLNYECHAVDLTNDKLKEIFDCDAFIHHHDHA